MNIMRNIVFFQKLYKRIVRTGEVYQINLHARDKMRAAERRDRWFLMNKLQKIDKTREVTDSQKEEIRKFWEPYQFAYKNDPQTQIKFYQVSGKFDPSYMGFGLQVHSLVRFWNNPTFSTFRNKNFSYLLFPFVKHPKNVLMNNYGIYLDEQFNILTETEALQYILKLLKEGEKLILKPTLDSGSGSSIVFLDNATSREDLQNYVKNKN